MKAFTEAGFAILVGESAEENDTMTFEICRPDDFWMHVAGVAGSHVMIHNPDKVAYLPDRVVRAASMAAVRYSKARNFKVAEVHMCKAQDVFKPVGAEPGKVMLRRYEVIDVVKEAKL